MTFDRAWRAFVDEESNRRAPAELEARVQQALSGRRPAVRRRRRGVVEGVAIAACACIAAIWSISRSQTDSAGVAPRLLAGPMPALVAYVAPVSSEPSAGATLAGRGAARRPRREETRSAVLHASNRTAPEALQLVRLRMPRQALAAFGLVLIDPEAAGMVHVDVLVGEDGLPRDIRRVWFEP